MGTNDAETSLNWALIIGFLFGVVFWVTVPMLLVDWVLS